ncbi:phasin family protein [Azospirillum sp. A39]|uniref:phasin family protein n=1 Tax=Azospirillum sp. A39 TaxID=3462279 RepID=UPI0040454EC1
MADKDTPIIKDAVEGMAKTAERGAAATRRAADAAAGTAQAGLDTAERATEQFRRIFGLMVDGDEAAAQQAQQNLETIAQCNRVLFDGMQAVWREWLGLAQDTVHRNMAGVDALMKCRSLPDLYAAQSELMKDEIGMLLSRGARMSTLSAQFADDAMRRIDEHNKAAARAAKRAA